jgi:hypothetical protein
MADLRQPDLHQAVPGELARNAMQQVADIARACGLRPELCECARPMTTFMRTRRRAFRRRDRCDDGEGSGGHVRETGVGAIRNA